MGVFRMRQELAETAALGALGWLVSRQDLLEVFLGSTGAGPEDLKARAAEPEFLASVLDFILMDDAWVMDCATAIGWRQSTSSTCGRPCRAADCRTGRDREETARIAGKFSLLRRRPAPPAGA
jgi:hypothetical protein